METITLAIRIRLLLFLIISSILSIAEILFALMSRNTLLIIASLVCLAILLPLLSTVLAIWEEIRIQIIRSFRAERPKRIAPLDRISSSITLRKISNLPVFRHIIMLIAKRLREDAVKAGVYTHIESLLAIIFLLVFAFIILVAVSLLLLIYIPLPLIIKNILTPLPALLPITCMVLLLSIPSYFQIKKMNRVSDIGDELPFFILYASIVQRAGINLYQAFERIVNKGIFKALEKEAKHIIRLFTFFTHSPLDALDEYANFNPSDKLKSIIKGYISVLRSGGDAAKYLEGVSEKLLSEYVNKWKSYVQTITLFGELLIAVFTLFPILFILGAIAFSQPLSKFFMILYITVVIPVVTIIMYALINQFQPKDRNNMSMPIKVIIASIIIFIILFHLLEKLHFSDLPTIIALSVVISTIPITVVSRVILHEIRSIEKALPQFIRDITEYIKIGYDVTQALERLPITRKYNKFFDNIIRGISRLLKMNVPLTIIAEFIETRSWMLKYSLFVVSELANVGALAPEPLEKLCDTIEKALMSKYEARTSLATYAFLAYITPLFLVILVFLVSNVILGMPTTTAGGMMIINIKLVQELLYLANVLTLVVAASLGILISKLRDQTILSTFHLSTILALSLLALKVQEIIPAQLLPIPLIKPG